MEEKMVVEESEIEGLGVFATAQIKKGEIICFMLGEEMTVEKVMEMYDSGEEREGDPFQIDSRSYINLEKPYVYINHCCEPNAGIRGKNELIALQDIEKGEEITYDYSTTEASDDEFWGDDYEAWSMECFCGSEICRGLIEEFKFLPEDVKMKYIGLKVLPGHIVKRFNLSL